jgi:hypothetical protein
MRISRMAVHVICITFAFYAIDPHFGKAALASPRLIGL